MEPAEDQEGGGPSTQWYFWCLTRGSKCRPDLVSPGTIFAQFYPGAPALAVYDRRPPPQGT